MDQVKTSMPNDYRMGKNRTLLTRMNISIQLYLCSHQPKGSFFWNVQNVAKNTSQHIYSDFRMLKNIMEIRQQALPKKLCISMDNTSTENKNYIYTMVYVINWIKYI